MMKTPISLIIDDSAPLVHIYRSHVSPPLTRDGREIKTSVPNRLLSDFCDCVECYGLKGKFSVVPCPAGQGYINDTIDGFSREALTEWLHTARTRLSPYFDFCPEILTHARTVDLKSGGFLEETELAWSRHATKEELSAYIAKALTICSDAGIRCTGVTSPWNFGEENEDAYVWGIADAFDKVFQQKTSWYFLHGLSEQKNIRAWVAYDNGGKTVISIPRTVADYFWGTIDINDTSEAFIRHTADYFLTEDGRHGAVIDALNRGSFPVICTHWQSMFSNGNFTGVKALAVVAQRIESHLSDRVEWVNFSEQAKSAMKDHILRPEF